MCRIASRFLLQRLKGSTLGEARDFNNIETRAIIKLFFYLQGKVPKEICAILIETLGEHAPSDATVKNWVAQFKHGDFSTCDAPRPGRPKTVNTAVITLRNMILAHERFVVFLTYLFTLFTLNSSMQSKFFHHPQFLYNYIFYY